MANPLPPPPTKSPDGSYAWVDWYRQLQQYVSQSGSVPWSVIDFAGSDIADIQQRDHESLSSFQGGTSGEHYHLTAAQHAALSAGPHNALTGLQGGGGTEFYHLTQAEYTALQNGRLPIRTKATDPVAADIPSGFSAVYKNTTSGLVKLWANDGGTFKSVTLT